MTEVRFTGSGPQQDSLQRVLLADDNDRYAKAITADLLKRGVKEVVRTYNAREAVRKLQLEGDSFDGVVTDISMENQLSGMSVLRAARKGGSKRLLAVASTGLDAPLAYKINYVILGLLYRSDFLIPKRSIKREGVVNWIPVRKK